MQASAVLLVTGAELSTEGDASIGGFDFLLVAYMGNRFEPI